MNRVGETEELYQDKKGNTLNQTSPTLFQRNILTPIP